MPQTASSPSKISTSPDNEPTALPFLLTSVQGEAARALLRYVASLPLPGPDAQLIATVVAIRAARSGTANLTGQDLSGLKLSDPRGAVDALRGLGWQVDDALFDGDPPTPVPVTVPALVREDDHPLPFGKQTRSRVSGWTTRALSAKPVKKLPPAARLASLFLAAHSTSKLLGQIPPDLPAACRASLPELLQKGFLTEFSEDRYRLAPAVQHLSGQRRPTAEEQSIKTAFAEPQFDVAAWEQWKNTATPALRRHVEAVELCAVCALPVERVAEAFTGVVRSPFFSQAVKNAYGDWKDAHPDRGPQAAAFTIAFRTEHGHGPSYAQLCAGLGWEMKRSLRGFVVKRLLSNEWLTDTGTVPWTLRPGAAAQAQGIALPKARSAAGAVPARA
ncbi:hypothetical protein N4G70_34565 [Streptomyces sp. ASQP_92]|uniref:hypothetical protein n=1 Tax=Streptomyces sp. ASQP_92 TaxID=2979116 RepID=UPI0021C0EB72|nr:hypothetical protein [Streptomyces sp. ASQP_92]MCT9093944.1 hypothetical protein [Streptomyces sp. ASQP_92]